MKSRIGFILLICSLLFAFAQWPQDTLANEVDSPKPLHPHVIDVSERVGNTVSRPSQSPMDAIHGRFLRNPFIPAQIVASDTVGHNASQRIDVQLANYERESRLFKSEIPLTWHTTPHLDDIGGWMYDVATHTLSWEGILEGANLEYQVEVLPESLPYIDLAEYGLANLCVEDLEVELEFKCDNETREFNLGINNDYALSLYGEEVGTIAVNSNGLLFGGSYYSSIC